MGKYEFDIYRKKAITNIQIKPTSAHDPNVLDGIFKGFFHRALTLCSDKFIEPELKFLIEVFTENGYAMNNLKRIVSEMKLKKVTAAATTAEVNNKTATVDENTSSTANESSAVECTVTLPWIPGLSPKLGKCYKKAGYKMVFKVFMKRKRTFGFF